MGRQEIQNESHESSVSSYFPSSSRYPCVPHPWPASVQRRSILLLQQQWQLCQREHPRRVPAQGQHGEDVVLHHWLEQQLWRPADLEEISQQPLVLHGLQQPRTMRNVKSVII